MKVRVIDAEHGVDTATLTAIFSECGFIDDNIGSADFDFDGVIVKADVMDVRYVRSDNGIFYNFVCILNRELKQAIQDYNTSFRHSIGSKLKALRESKGLTTYDLSHMTAVKQSTVSRIENGKWSASLDLLQRLCRGLNCELLIKEK